MSQSALQRTYFVPSCGWGLKADFLVSDLALDYVRLRLFMLGYKMIFAQ
jgi:hypothetical protein